MGKKTITYFNAGAFGHGNVKITDCGYHETDQGHYSSQKVMDHCVLHCILDGKGAYSVGGKTYNLGKNDCFMLFSHVPILYQSDVLDPWIYYWIGFDGANIESLIRLWGITKEHPVIHLEEIDTVTNILKTLVENGTATISGTHFAIGNFYLLSAALISNNTTNKPLTQKELYVNQVVATIQHSYDKKLSVQKLADSIGLERTYLYRIFHESMGMSINQYISNLRIERAKYLLANTDMSMSEIAYFCGYASETYFSIAFKKVTTISPQHYRASVDRNT